MNKVGRWTKSYMQSMTKADLIEYIECLEHNVKAHEETIKNQYDNFKRLLDEPKEPCDLCKDESCFANLNKRQNYKYCRFCGRELEPFTHQNPQDKARNRTIGEEKNQ